MREARGVTQSALAAAIGVDAQTVSRWERGERTPKAGDYRRAIAFLGDQLGSGLGGNMSRGTVTLPPRIGEMIDRFERDAVRMGASDREADYVRAILRTPDTLRLLLVADDGSTLSTAQQEDELALLLDGFRLWVQRRIDRRSGDEGELPTRSGAPALKQNRQSSPTAGLPRAVGKVVKKR